MTSILLLHQTAVSWVFPPLSCFQSLNWAWLARESDLPNMPRMANFKKPSGPFVTVEGMADVTMVTGLALHTPLRPSVTCSVVRRVGSSVTPVSVSWVYTHKSFWTGVSVHLQSAVVTFTSSLWCLEIYSLVIVPVWFLTFYLILPHSILSFSAVSISLPVLSIPPCHPSLSFPPSLFSSPSSPLHPSVLSRCLRVMMTMWSPASSSVVTASSAARMTTRSKSGRLSQER